jgi:hypothetical protein
MEGKSMPADDAWALRLTPKDKEDVKLLKERGDYPTLAATTRAALKLLKLVQSLEAAGNKLQTVDSEGNVVQIWLV